KFCGDACGAGWTATEPKGDAIDCNDHDSGYKPGATETCDAKDEDCDGLIDEDAKDSCTREHGSGRCVNSVCTVDSCEPGFGNCDGKGVNGCAAGLNARDGCGGWGTVCGACGRGEGTNVKNVGACACEGPAFGDASNCRGPGPIAVGSLWTCGIDSTADLSCIG